MIAIQCVCVVWRLLATPLDYDVGMAVKVLPPQRVVVRVEHLENMAKNNTPTVSLTVKF